MIRIFDYKDNHHLFNINTESLPSNIRHMYFYDHSIDVEPLPDERVKYLKYVIMAVDLTVRKYPELTRNEYNVYVSEVL